MRLIGRRPGLLAGCLIGALVVLVGPGVASAKTIRSLGGTGLLVTVAARSCPTYDAITANLARNNIQESLRDLGPNTAYGPGEPINPTTEADNQPRCSPLPEWRFTLGTGIGGTVEGTWGSLSFVSGAMRDNILTQGQTPMLDDDGRPVPGSVIQGATTFELTRQQADLAARRDLWIQGGTPTDPVLDQIYPGAYGFGALRCAIDNLNGDNVEFIQIPSGSRHVFCYAYYVVPPPSSGTLIVRKVVRGAPDANESFVMGGNVSYEPSGTFSLDVHNGQPAEETFFRAATTGLRPPWTIQEQVPSSWILTGLGCTHGASVVTTNRADARATIRLAAGDTVTCTYTNTLRPTAGALLLRKISENGVGTFEFEVRSLSDMFQVSRSISTRIAGVPAVARPIKLDPGRYRITEAVPQTPPRQHWTLEGITCNGRRSTGIVSIRSLRGTVCTFTNKLHQVGRLAVRQVTLGGIGTTGFVISPLGQPDTQYRKVATTTSPGSASPARGDSTLGIPLGEYVITQTETASDPPATWTLISVSCDGRLVPFAQGRAVVRITSHNPRATCTFTNVLTPGTEPPVLPPGVIPAVPGEAQPNLILSKRAAHSRAQVGDVLGYDLVVRNAGPVAAENVVVADRPASGADLVSAGPSQGSCNERLPVICRLGTIPAGGQATVHVRLRLTEPGTIRNFAVVGSGAMESRLRDNLAIAAVRVIQPPDLSGCASGVRAHIAC